MNLTKDKRAELIASLVTDKFSTFKEGDEKFLESVSDDRLEEFRSAASDRKIEDENRAKLENDGRNTAARLKIAEEKLRTLENRQLTEEEFLASPAGETLRTLVAEKKAQDASERDGLINSLKTLGANTEDELKAMPVSQLKMLAKYAKVDQPETDYRARGIRMEPRAAGEAKPDYTPKNPYDPQIKAAQASKAVN